MPLRISILQLLCLTAIAGSAVYAMYAAPGEPIWRNEVLRYERPTVPNSFRNVYQEAVTVHFNQSGPTVEFDNGSDMFERNHETGWRIIRQLFFRHEDWQTDYDVFDFYDEYDYAKLNFRDPEEHCFLAQWEGRQQCRQQLTALLQQYDEHELRNKIAYPSFVRLLLPGLIFVASLSILLKQRRIEPKRAA